MDVAQNYNYFLSFTYYYSFLVVLIIRVGHVGSNPSRARKAILWCTLSSREGRNVGSRPFLKHSLRDETIQY